VRDNRHTGVTERVRQYIRKHGPSTCVTLAADLGITVIKAQAAVYTMVGRTGGMVRSARKNRHILYGIAGLHPDMDAEKKKTKARDPRAIVGPRYVKPFKELRRTPADYYGHQQLAIAAHR
jgi:hypothetical protein